MQGQRESTFYAYTRLDAPKAAQDEPIQDHDIRITGPGKTRNYIAYATGLLTQKGYTAVELKAMGQAINKTVTIAEIIKRRIPGLHQNNQIGSIAIQDTCESIEEGFDSISVMRHVSVISITLSTLPLNKRSPGYQPPLPAEMVKTHLSPGPHMAQQPGSSVVSAHAGPTVQPGQGSNAFLGGPLVDSYMPTVAAMQAAAQQQQMQGRYEEMSLLAAQQQTAQQHGQALLQQPELACAEGRTVHFDGRTVARTSGNSNSNLGGRMMGGSGSHLISS